MMLYGFTEDGKLATFTNLDKIFNPEKCLDLPMPSGKTFDVKLVDDAYTAAVFAPNSIYYGEDTKERGLDLIRKILEDAQKNPDKKIEISLHRSLFRDDRIWRNDLYEDAEVEFTDKTFTNWLNLHEKTKRGNKIYEMALRNVVVKKILDVVSDPITQYNLMIPISMNEQRAESAKSVMSADEQELTSDNPSAKILMQIQNMTGRDVIGIGASSLKAFFAASTYFNVNALAIKDCLDLLNDEVVVNEQDINSKLFNFVLSNVFNSKFSDRGLITFANINYLDAIESLGEITYIQLTEEDLNKITDLNDGIKDYINENGELNIRQLLLDLQGAANGSWDSPIDAAYSLSGLISAATDFWSNTNKYLHI